MTWRTLYVKYRKLFMTTETVRPFSSRNKGKEMPNVKLYFRRQRKDVKVSNYEHGHTFHKTAKGVQRVSVSDHIFN